MIDIDAMQDRYLGGDFSGPSCVYQDIMGPLFQVLKAAMEFGCAGFVPDHLGRFNADSAAVVLLLRFPPQVGPLALLKKAVSPSFVSGTSCKDVVQR